MADINALWQEYQASKQAPQVAPIAMPNPNVNPNAAQKGAETLAVENAKKISAQPTPEAKMADAMSAQSVNEAIDNAINGIQGNWFKTGTIGSQLADIPGTGAYDTKQQLEQVRANIGLDKLKEMKQQSSTGASGLGSLNKEELASLQAYLGSLDMGQSNDQLISNLRNIKSHYGNLYEQATGQKPEYNDWIPTESGAKYRIVK